jgi:hypothetical protein
VESPVAAAAIPAPVGRLISSDSLPVGGFTPGMVLADRYRIIGLIGRGGMGEVYRADDLKLGQPVALKFLPKALADDPVRRERLFAEVRIARQVSHPNICRVYDIAELDGRHFLTMEYIDGEDLASLLKRIGSLHGAKALDVAQQLCAGLAAAHDKGVLHRDLKPANVMIDGRGRVRITDFGLAVAAGEEVSESDVSGTPPYMAPEQFAGKGASVRSDIYALGLVFYEIFTGRRAFEAKTIADLRAKKEASSPPAPSEVVRDIDPIIERVVLRCIEKDPRQRPASATQVATALPGGDPLAAAIAAGETPSPEMVAASGSTEGLKPWMAWTCLAFIILGIGAVVLLGRQTNLFQRVPIKKSPDVMVEKAQEILKSLGYADPIVDSDFRFVGNEAYFNDVKKNDQSATRFEKLPAIAVQCWYRQSPKDIVNSTPLKGINPTDPPLTADGESIVWQDSQGRLTGFLAIPHLSGKPFIPDQPTNWSVLFNAAGLVEKKCTPVDPDLTYSAYADYRAAWTGVLPDRPDIPIRIEAAAWQGKPVSWRLIVLVPQNSSASTNAASVLKTVSSIAGTLMNLSILGAGLFFARRNLRMGRGDRRGAFRLAYVCVSLGGVAGIFSKHHAGDFGPLLLPVVGGLTWMAYIAFEPFVRRRWPGMLVGWSRLFAGDCRDPLVGRDLLFGCVAGVILALLHYSEGPLTSLFNLPQITPLTGPPNAEQATFYLLSGAREFAAIVSRSMLEAIITALSFGLLLFVLRSLLRSTWAAAVVAILAYAAIAGPGGPVFLILSVLVVFLVLFVLRFGLLALTASLLLFNFLCIFPITTDRSAFYFLHGLVGLAIMLAFALYAFHTSLGGQPMFGRASLED